MQNYEVVKELIEKQTGVGEYAYIEKDTLKSCLQVKVYFLTPKNRTTKRHEKLLSMLRVKCAC